MNLAKTDVLVKLTKELAKGKGRPSEITLNNFFDAGYIKASLVDVVVDIADKVVMNYLHNITQVLIDFPIAADLETAAV